MNRRYLEAIRNPDSRFGERRGFPRRPEPQAAALRAPSWFGAQSCRRLRQLPPCLIAAAALFLTAAQATAQTNGNAAASSRQLPHTLLRDPFWPTGWQPTYFGQIDTSKADGGVLTRWEEAEKMLHLTGLSRNTNGKFIGIVKGVGVVQEGDAVSVNLGGLTYKWTIRSISSNGLVLEKVAAQPMR